MWQKVLHSALVGLAGAAATVIAGLSAGNPLTSSGSVEAIVIGLVLAILSRLAGALVAKLNPPV